MGYHPENCVSLSETSQSWSTCFSLLVLTESDVDTSVNFGNNIHPFACPSPDISTTETQRPQTTHNYGFSSILSEAVYERAKARFKPIQKLAVLLCDRSLKFVCTFPKGSLQVFICHNVMAMTVG
jgi:hypothetical protein